MPLRTPDCDDAGQEHASRDHTANPHREEAVSRWTDEDTSTETGAGRLRAGRGRGWTPSATGRYRRIRTSRRHGRLSLRPGLSGDDLHVRSTCDKARREGGRGGVSRSPPWARGGPARTAL